MAGTGTGAEETGTETQAGEAAPEALEEVITIDVQVCMVSIPFRSQSSQEQRGTRETIVTTIGGTLIDEIEMIVGETTDGTTATGTILEIGTHPGILKPGLPRG